MVRIVSDHPILPSLFCGLGFFGEPGRMHFVALTLVFGIVGDRFAGRIFPAHFACAQHQR
jgi:hypothetical protein